MTVEYLDERAQLHNKAIQSKFQRTVENNLEIVNRYLFILTNFSEEQAEEELSIDDEQEETIEEEDRIEISEKIENLDREETLPDD